jgi:hypothetical protein
LINQLRAILLERGIVIAQGRRNFERELDEAARRVATIPGIGVLQ